MDKALAEITVQPLILAFLPAAITVGIIFRWAGRTLKLRYMRRCAY